MKPEWKAYLQDDGAEFAEDGSVVSFGNPERERRVTTAGNVICDLSHYGLIAAYGEDAADFLQGQFSNDIQAVDAGHSQLSSYCTPKGRMLANFRVIRRDGTYYLRLPQALLEPMLKRLRMYVLRSRVTLEDASASLIRMGLSGPDAATLLGEALGCTPPQAVDDTLTRDGITVARIIGHHPRYEIYGSLEPLHKLWTRLNVHGAPVGAPCWGLLNVLAGIPVVQPATSEAFVPQMANMELIGGVSFQKGCYPGQEIVARMQYLGNLKRRMYRVHIDADAADPGTEIVDADAEGNPAGRLVEAYRHPDGGLEGLAVLQIGSADQGAKLRLGQRKGAHVTLRELPYSLEVAATG
ncbi:CAF17-like 4Fe-4S cluster assembly/insertion protein YgfZ [Acidihalobacter prosperus]|uniref:Glycine cleavage system protein T n=1 Tax=Acidihalobacter prosperus TaxID=160660 RepID=A0A1A6C846_9GAMM|nr:folate-binding protein YgfZ [Acidihalobacter prosperus]OBS10719.1 glycine cleavage system protein T [Acidihalobacter prosperus]